MAYRTVAKWQIDMGEVQEAQGWRSILGIGQYTQEIGIIFRTNETRIKVRTSDLVALHEIAVALPALARARYIYHTSDNVGSMRAGYDEQEELTRKLEDLGVHLPGWLR